MAKRLRRPVRLRAPRYDAATGSSWDLVTSKQGWSLSVTTIRSVSSCVEIPSVPAGLRSRASMAPRSCSIFRQDCRRRGCVIAGPTVRCARSLIARVYPRDLSRCRSTRSRAHTPAGPLGSANSELPGGFDLLRSKLFDYDVPRRVHKDVIAITVLAGCRVVAVGVAFRVDHLIARQSVQRDRRLEVLAR